MTVWSRVPRHPCLPPKTVLSTQPRTSEFSVWCTLRKQNSAFKIKSPKEREGGGGGNSSSVFGFAKVLLGFCSRWGEDKDGPPLHALGIPQIIVSRD